MAVSRYKLNEIGWIGAAMFVLPTPLSAYYISSKFSITEAEARYNALLNKVPAPPEMSMLYLTLLATASLVGLVLLLVGRDIETIR